MMSAGKLTEPEARAIETTLRLTFEDLMGYAERGEAKTAAKNCPCESDSGMMVRDGGGTLGGSCGALGQHPGSPEQPPRSDQSAAKDNAVCV